MKKLLCWLGLHAWAVSYYNHRNGDEFKRCANCGRAFSNMG